MGIAASAPLMAQGARGAGPDARTPPAGTIRIGFGVSWSRNTDLYDDGTVRELGARYSFDPLGAGVIPSMSEAESAARDASGVPDLVGSLGASTVHARRATDMTPLTLEVGVTSRLAVGIVVPLVTAAVRVDAGVNRLGTEANFGLNPALTATGVAASNESLVAQLFTARTYVAQQIATCASTPGGLGCAPYVASPAVAQQLVTNASQFSAAITSLYGTTSQPGLPFVPLASSAVQYAVASRLAGFKAQFAAFGAPAVSAAAPLGAPAPITGVQFQQLLTDTKYGIASTGLIPVTRRGVGNVELQAQYTLHDSYGTSTSGAAASGEPWWRASLGGTFQLGASRQSSPTDLLPVDLGDPGTAIAGTGIAEIGIGRHFALASAVSLTSRQGTTVTLRVPQSPTDVLPGLSQELPLHVTPGAEVLATIAPRWTPNDALALAATYSYRSKTADSYTIDQSGGTFLSPPDPSILGKGSAQQEHRFGASIAYSTVASWEAGHARWPIEVTLTHFQTTSGSGTAVPKLAYDGVTFRWYWRPFGGGRRAAPR